MERKKSGKLWRILLTLTLAVGLLPALPQRAGAGIIGASVAFDSGVIHYPTVSVVNEGDTTVEFKDAYDKPFIDIEVGLDLTNG
ncbi:hypothetical protein SDC9_74709 [bioreactor metagenome]|uniref:Uncharacterized protein n=1 Tax=bioreactor metagenome TaxID=1076179 RepID=A0A644YIH8_9ZZZZ